MAAPLHRVLIVDPNPSPWGVPGTVSTVSEAVQRLEGAGYDAVLVKVSRPGDLSLVARIRTEVPHVRVLAVTPEGLQLGSDGTTHPEPLLRQCREALMDRLCDAADERKRIGGPLEMLVPFIVEYDDRHALPLRHAFEKLGFPFPHPVARNPKGAMLYLESSPSPRPTLIFAALPSPKGPTFEFLSWIRSRDALTNLPVFVAGDSFSPATQRQVIEAGADAYFSKPTFPGEHEELVRSVAVKWAALFGQRFPAAGGRP